MKKLSVSGCRFHRRADAAKAQTLEQRAVSDRAQKTAGRNVDYARDDFRLMIVAAADRQITVSQARGANEAVLLTLAARAMETNAFIAAESTQAKFATNRKMNGIDLVTGENEACKVDP